MPSTIEALQRIYHFSFKPQNHWRGYLKAEARPISGPFHLGETEITSVHRDYAKGDAENAPTTSISILDSVANPEYVESTTAAWNSDTSNAEGYSKSIKLEGTPGFETFENY